MTQLAKKIRVRLSAGETTGDVAHDLGLDVVPEIDCDKRFSGLAIVLPGWTADDGNAEVRYPGAESGEEVAQEYVDDGDWNVAGTKWIRIQTWRRGLVLDTDGDIIEIVAHHDSHLIEIAPEEPSCEGVLDHDWQTPHDIVGGCEQNPGVWGHGGGVIIEEVCQHCGCGRTTDTWAQDSDTGIQGLTSVTYEEDKYQFGDESAP